MSTFCARWGAKGAGGATVTCLLSALMFHAACSRNPSYPSASQAWGTPAPTAPGTPPTAPEPGVSAASPKITGEHGFTELLPSPDTATVYVSSSTGDDANDGRAPERAVKSAERGVSLLRDGYPDWLLFKRGDVWQTGLGGWALSGRSARERMVIGAYGTGERPRFDFEGEAIAVNGAVSEKKYIDNLAFTSLHLLGKNHDASRGTPHGPPSNCVGWLRGGRDVLFEDMRFEFCAVIVIFYDGFPAERFRFHRNLFLDSFSLGNTHAQGMLLHGVKGMVLEQNVFDRCGWHPAYPKAKPTIFNHCVYWQQGGPADGVVRGNIIMRGSSHGVQMRSSGHVEGNLFVRNAIGGFIAGNFDRVPEGIQGTAVGNVFSEGEDITPREGHPGTEHRGWGWDFSPDGRLIRNAIIKDNIFSLCRAKDCKPLLATYPHTEIANNIVWKWPSTAPGYLPNSVGPFRDPERTVATYNASLGGENSFEAFAGELRKQSKTNWRPEYTAERIIQYFREGFARAP